MAQIDHKHPTMTLYLARNNPITHWILLVLCEKTIEPNVVFVDAKKRPAEFDRINPRGILPLLTDQEGLMLYTSSIITEYLEERFPHPPLLPIYPIMRAKCRQVIQQIEQNWYGLLQQIQSGSNVDESIELLRQGLVSFVPVFEFKPYFLSDEITLVDCCIAPVLWGLEQLNIPIVAEIKSAYAYQKRLFERENFQNVLRKLEPKTD